MYLLYRVFVLVPFPSPSLLPLIDGHRTVNNIRDKYKSRSLKGKDHFTGVTPSGPDRESVVLFMSGFVFVTDGCPVVHGFIVPRTRLLP